MNMDEDIDIWVSDSSRRELTPNLPQRQLDTTLAGQKIWWAKATACFMVIVWLTTRLTKSLLKC